MALLQFHARCRDAEAALRGRISDLEEREDRLLERIAELQTQMQDQNKEWIERYTTLLNPAAARMMAINQRIGVGPAPTPQPDPAPVQVPDFPTTSADAMPQISYADRGKPVRPMPVLSPSAAGFRPARPPIYFGSPGSKVDVGDIGGLRADPDDDDDAHDPASDAANDE